ncbi:response regulator transcription factor [Streptomyces purpurogeneiscleroticus]|uniref:response regulator transcription factor n=1 Tax=Streptomyces purpurogeneiscleroticus TaxID=68259 RepID=UPI001CC17154|nr:response regulator transcription factor [Streptomyces purpurogeneiscleroticus]MBZ4014589.1 helix-turn-helix transcriptional regulator [Streptomyces purpurogeneiscleroticus]
MIRVLLVEENGLLRGALAALLTRESDMEVVTQCGGDGQVLARALSYRPDVVVIDVDARQDEALATAGELCARLPECRTLLVAGSPALERLRSVLALRPPGLIGKDAPCDRLVEGIRKVVGGQRYVDPGLALLVLDAAADPLTPREREVLRLAADGAPGQEIADRLSLSVGTVRNHLSAITRKVGARNRIDAIRIARESGWL